MDQSLVYMVNPDLLMVEFSFVVVYLNVLLSKSIFAFIVKISLVKYVTVELIDDLSILNLNVMNILGVILLAPPPEAGISK